MNAAPKLGPLAGPPVPAQMKLAVSLVADRRAESGRRARRTCLRSQTTSAVTASAPAAPSEEPSTGALPSTPDLFQQPN